MSIPFLLDEKPTVVPVSSAGERSGGARSVRHGAARSNSERAAPSACVGRRFSAVRLCGIDRLDAPAHAAGRGSVGGLSAGSAATCPNSYFRRSLILLTPACAQASSLSPPGAPAT